MKDSWPELFANGTLRIPPSIVDGLNLIWYSDLVVSGGGTMNREAAALDVPVYSTFRGKIGAVDRYLSQAGRLVLLESAEDVPAKLRLIRRQRPARPGRCNGGTLGSIVEQIVGLMQTGAAHARARLVHGDVDRIGRAARSSVEPKGCVTP